MNETQTQTENAAFKKITREELKKKMEGNPNFRLWDTRTEEYFTKETLPGAKWVPVDRVEMELETTGAGKDEEIVVYCASFTCPASKTAANFLVKKGYRNVSAYEGGLADWKEAGLPTQTQK